ncbi:hypothetical protein GQ54DRAFT_295778 [Martensiomyces pterosporus]|nr:hypothetical protein GQ54DRAFT_295778 [Martensiomyces pterosporus]
MPDPAPFQQLPFELMLAICAQFHRCPCSTPDDQAFSLGCTRNHPPAAFGNTELSALRQTSRSWRAAALREGLSQLVTSNRWMRRPNRDRLLAISQRYARCTRRLVFRSSDFYHNGPRRTEDGGLAGEFEAVLSMGWPCLESVVVEWFSGDSRDHARIAAAVRRYAPRIREFYIRDKALSVAQLAPHIWGPSSSSSRLAIGGGMGRCAAIRRLAIKPYGYDQQWVALAPAERGAAAMLVGMPGQFTTLAIGGADFTPEFMGALQRSQPKLESLSIEHAWVDALATACAQGVCLPSVTSLHLENIMVSHTAPVLPLTSRMFPNLHTLTVRHVWKHVGGNARDDRTNSARGAVSLQNEHWLQPLWERRWPELRVLALPAIADSDAERLVSACPSLTRLVTNSLDYSGPPLSASGLVTMLHGLQHLRHLSIEQRRADGTPGYEIMDSALCRLMGAASELLHLRGKAARRASTASTIILDSPVLAAQPDQSTSTAMLLDSDTEVDSDAEESTRHGGHCATASAASQLLEEEEECEWAPTSSKPLNTLYIPRASFTSSTLDMLAMHLPNLVKLSVTLRSDAFFGFKKGHSGRASAAGQKSQNHQSLKWIGLSADEDILADSLWLSAWISQRFPKLQECSTNHARSHKRVVAELRDAMPQVKFTRFNSRALQTTCN